MMELKVGDFAPDFEVNNQDGVIVSNQSLLGKRYILYFYPKNNTSGCTAEACSLRDGRVELEQMGFDIYGVSADSEKSHRDFIAKHNLNFDLLSDGNRAMINAYGAYKKIVDAETTGIKRITFVIDGEGKVEKIFKKVDSKAHFEQIVDSYSF